MDIFSNGAGGGAGWGVYPTLGATSDVAPSATHGWWVMGLYDCGGKGGALLGTRL